MSASRISQWSTILGIFLMLVLLVVEIFTHVLGTVGYVAIAGCALWLSKNTKQIQLIAISATVLLLVGYFLAIDLQHPSNQATYIVNRVSALVVIWFAYYFTLRYRKTQENEHTQRIELEERRLAETRLRSSLEIYEAIARNFPVGWIGILDEKKTYIVAGGKGLGRTGIRATDIIGQNFSHVLETDIAEPFLVEALNDKHVLFEIPYHSRVLEIHASPFQVHQKKKWILVVVHDITSLKEIEAGLVKALEKERALGEMKSQFVTMASHEFRTPLTTILSSASLLSSYSGEKYEKEKSSHIGRIKQSVKLLNGILNDFLLIDTLKDGDFKPVYRPINLVDFLKEIVNEVELFKQGNQTLRVNHSGVHTVMSDSQFLRSILHNLLSNAFKYSHSDDQILLEVEATNGELVIRVIDHGMGIPQEEQEYIFTRFFRAHNVVNIQGTGLGLSITKNYLDLLKGSIKFFSIQNDGSVFTVCVPIEQ